MGECDKKKPYSVIKYHVPSYQSACDAFPLSVSTGQLELITRARSRTPQLGKDQTMKPTPTNDRSAPPPSVSVGMVQTLSHTHTYTPQNRWADGMFSPGRRSRAIIIVTVVTIQAWPGP